MVTADGMILKEIFKAKTVNGKLQYTGGKGAAETEDPKSTKVATPEKPTAKKKAPVATPSATKSQQPADPAPNARKAQSQVMHKHSRRKLWGCLRVRVR